VSIPKEARKRVFCKIAGTSWRERNELEIDDYYRRLAQYAPEEISDAIMELSKNWRQFSELSFENDNLLQVNRPHKVEKAAEQLWNFTERFCGPRTGVYLGLPKIRLIVDQSYEGADQISLPFYWRTKSMLEHTGFKVVAKDATDYDATFAIEAEGTPKGANYISIGWRWSGASIRGVISLSTPEEKLSWRFADTEYPPMTIYSNPYGKFTEYQTRNDAPYKLAFTKSFIPVLEKVLTQMAWEPD